MKTRVLGKSAIECSEIGLGCWQLGGDFGVISEEQAQDILAAADEGGIRFWDTADVYGDGQSERFIGEYLSTHSAARARTVVATKVGRSPDLYPDGYTREGIRRHVEQSLDRLQMSCLELIQLHCIPEAYLQKADVFRWLDELQTEGLIRAYGASVETLDEALYCIENTGVTSLQMIVNLFRQDALETVFPQALAQNVGIIVRLPLASGLLSGKFTRHTQFAEQDHRHYNKDGAMFSVGETFSGIPFEKGIELVDELSGLVKPEKNLATSALRWLLDQEAVTTVIAGASSRTQVLNNASVSDSASLAPATHDKLYDFYQLKVRQHVRGRV